MIKISKKQISRQKTIIILFLFGGLMAVIAGLFLTNMAWQNYQAGYVAKFNHARVAINEVLVETTPEPSLSVENKLDRIINIQKTISSETNSYCEVNIFVEWQSFVRKFANMIQVCDAKKNDLQNLLSKIGLLTSYLKSEQTLSKIIQVASDETSQNNQVDKWKDVEAIWLKAVANSEEISDIEQFKPVRLLALTKLRAMADAWRQLSDANNTKNRQQFEEAQSSIVKAYASFGEITDISRPLVDGLISDINKSYKTSS